MPAEAGFHLPVPADGRGRLARRWLALGVSALLGSGVFSILLVLARTPAIGERLPWEDFFHTALVVHVDLSVLVWFLSCAGLLWTLNSTPRWLALGRAAWALAAAGTALMAAAPFTGAGQPLMSNYIPVLRQPVFLAGLLTFAAGITLLVLRGMTAIPRVGPRSSGAAALRFGLNTSVVATALALLAFGWSYLGLPAGLGGRPFYELLFWGGGHVLQFTWTLLLLVAWLWLADALGAPPPITPRVALVFFALGLASIFATPVIYLAEPVTSAAHVLLFTWLMQYGGSLAALPLALAVCLGLLHRRASLRPADGPLLAALGSSIILFGTGGGIGFLIQGSNVTIPAHYHGSIVGVTLALMGLTFLLLPRLGAAPVRPRWATLQPVLYGAGQLLHVAGLVWSGGYGVQRKVAGSAQGLDQPPEIAAMALMGLGGLIAILGGLLFIVVVFDAWRRRPRD